MFLFEILPEVNESSPKRIGTRTKEFLKIEFVALIL